MTFEKLNLEIVARVIRLELAATLSVPLTGCVSPHPVLYPNSRLNSVGQQTAEADTADSRRLAEGTGAGSPGSAARNSLGGVAIGAATGAAGGLLGSPFGGTTVNTA